MAYGGSHAGNNDPEKIIANYRGIQEIESRDLLAFYHAHSGTIGALALTWAHSKTGPKALDAVAFSDRLQRPFPGDDTEVLNVIQALSSNAAFYDDVPAYEPPSEDTAAEVHKQPRSLEDAIDADPEIAELQRLKNHHEHVGRTFRLRRSLIAIAHLSAHEAAEAAVQVTTPNETEAA